MKKKILIALLLLTAIIILFVSCTANIVIPHSSEDYVNGEWTVRELKEHFEELGFSKVEICGNTTAIIGVYAENDESLYESFEKGQEISPSRKIGIYTEFKSKEPISVSNSTEFASFVEIGNEDTVAWLEFLEAHAGESIVFDGTITNWYDEFFWVGIDFNIAVENSKKLTFSKNNVNLIDLGMTGDFHYNKYHTGLITEGMRVHVVTRITEKDSTYTWELDSISVIE